MNKIKLWEILGVIVLLFIVFAGRTMAAVRCETQYGGGETCVRTGELQMDKEVWDPKEAQYVDNLGITSYRFSPGEEIIFKLKIKNVGDEKFDKVYVTDTLPSFLNLSSGDLSFEITDLDPDETVEREIKAKVVSDNRFDKETICDVNTAEVKHDDEHDKDTAQVCASKKVLGLSVSPNTGADNRELALILLGMGVIGGMGIVKIKWLNG